MNSQPPDLESGALPLRQDLSSSNPMNDRFFCSLCCHANSGQAQHCPTHATTVITKLAAKQYPGGTLGVTLCASTLQSDARLRVWIIPAFSTGSTKLSITKPRGQHRWAVFYSPIAWLSPIAAWGACPEIVACLTSDLNAVPPAQGRRAA